MRNQPSNQPLSTHIRENSKSKVTLITTYPKTNQESYDFIITSKYSSAIDIIKKSLLRVNNTTPMLLQRISVGVDNTDIFNWLYKY